MGPVGGAVSPFVNQPPDLARVLGDTWPLLLEHLADAMLVIDSERTLRFANGQARQLLGFQPGEVLGTRCRMVTGGLDCGEACPLTFAIERGLEVVEGFSAVYRRRDGSPVPVQVTVVPLRDENGGLAGHVEILRPTEPHHGFFLVGDSEAAVRLRRRVAELASTGDHLAVAGEAPAVEDVARALHRMAGLGPELFHAWPGRWDAVPSWPPGTLYVDDDGFDAAIGAAPDGWRVIARVRAQAPGAEGLKLEVLDLLDLGLREDDLPMMIAAWVDQMRSGLRVEPEALQRLSRMALELGLEGLRPVLRTAVAAAGERLESTHLPGDGYGAALLDELLRSPCPLTALEERVLREVLARCGWRMQDAADRLCISRVTLWRKLKEHGIERE